MQPWQSFGAALQAWSPGKNQRAWVEWYMVRLEACVDSEGRGGPLSVRFVWSKAAQHTWSLQICQRPWVQC